MIGLDTNILVRYLSDYLIGATSRQAGCAETVSFDSKLKGEKGFRWLK